jgi:hypothetical protein
MLAEAKEISIFSRFKQLGRNYMYVSSCYMLSNHPMVQLLEELSTLVDNPGRGGNEQPLISEYYKEVTPLGRLIQPENCLPPFNYTYESLFYKAKNIFRLGKTNKGSKGSQRGIQKDYTRKNENQ